VKKCFRTYKYKRFNSSHSKKQAKRALHHSAWQKSCRRHNQFQSDRQIKTKNARRHKFWDYKKVRAPQCFSFIKNPKEVSKFIQRLKKHFVRKEKVFVVLEDVHEVGYGAIVVLLSIMVKFKAQGIKFNGNFPADPIVDLQIKRSGFFDNLFSTFKDTQQYQISSSQKHGIHTHANKSVSAKLGSDIITDATKTIWGEERRCQGVQRVLVELMQNTNNHADIGKQGEKHWWLSVNHDQEAKRVSFSFVDYGVGVFTSLENKKEGSKFFDWKPILSNVFSITSNTEVMKLILSGELHKTVTGKPFRGKGLPGIAQALKRNQISNLFVITNNVYSNVANEEYTVMTIPFSGTFIYWEVSEDNENCK